MQLRTTLLLAAAGVTLFFSSCTREYTCRCEIVYSGSPGLPDTVIRSYPVTDTKKKAKSICEENSTTSDNNGIHTDENCHLF